MNTWIFDTAIARLLSANAVVLAEEPNSQMVGKPDRWAVNFRIVRNEAAHELQGVTLLHSHFDSLHVTEVLNRIPFEDQEICFVVVVQNSDFALWEDRPWRHLRRLRRGLLRRRPGRRANLGPHREEDHAPAHLLREFGAIPFKG